MKTIVHVTLTDEERTQLAQNVFSRKQMVSRNEVTQLVQDHIKELLDGRRVIPGAGVSHEHTETGIRGGLQSSPPCPITNADESGPSEEPSDTNPPQYLVPRDSDTELKAVCKKILSYIEAGYDGPGYIESVIRATGIR